MKILKSILIGLVAIVAILLIVAAFSKKDLTISREVLINKPKTEVYDYVKYLKNQNDFSKWAKMDPAMRKTFTGTDGTVGFVSAWDSDSSDVGKGEQRIVKIVPGEQIDYEIHFIKPFEAICPAQMEFDEVNAEQTKVKWTFHEHMSYPMNLMLLCMDMDKMIGDDLQTGLSNLKGILEK